MAGCSDKLPSFTTPLPDEILFSVVSRYNCLSGNRSDSETLYQLFNSRSPVTFTCLPSNLATLISKFPSGWTTSSSDLIEKNTTFPYYEPFLSENQISSAIAQMLSSNGNGIKMGMGLSASRIGALDIPRYCPECAAGDNYKFGCAYWHRSHLLPGVVVCFQHKTVLNEINFPPVRPCRHNLFLPEFVDPGYISNKRMDLSTAQLEVLLSIAGNSHRLMMLNLNHLPSDLVHTAYKKRLEDIGLLNAHGTVRQRELHTFLNSQYSDISEIFPYNRLFPTISSDQSWIASMFRKPRKSTHPLKHLLIISAIYDSLPDFIKSIGSDYSQLEESPSNLNNIKLFDIIDLNRLIVKEKLSLRQTSTILGISVTTLSIEANKYGINLQRKRPKRYLRKTEICAIQLLTKGKPLSEVSLQLNVSVQHLNRLLRSNPKTSYLRKSSLFRAERRRRRQILQNLLAANLLFSRTQVRHAIPSVWSWLYRHDPEWMQTALPPPIQREPIQYVRIDWERRDKTAAALVKKCAEDLLMKSTKPVRISRTALARSAGIQTLIKMHSDMLPESINCLDQFSESIETFQVRRVHYCARELSENGSPTLPWHVKKSAGLPQKLSQQVQQALQEVAGVFSHQDHELIKAFD